MVDPTPFSRHAAPAAAAVLLAAAAPAGAQVEVQALAPPDLFSTPAAGPGLGPDLWKGTSAAVARDLLPKVTAKPLSPAAADLARRLLATGANGPDGAGDDPDLGAARLQGLIALGDAAGADAILDRTPGVAGSSALSLAAAEAALITGADDKACKIGDALGVDRGGSYWLRLRAFCQAKAGQADAAQLTFTLAQQQTKDADYVRLMGAMLAGGGAPGAASLRNGLDYALSRQLGLDVQAAAGAAAPALKPVLKAPEPAANADLTAAQATALAALRQAKGAAAFAEAARTAAPTFAALAQAEAPLQDPALFARAALIAGDAATARIIRGRMTGDTVPGAGPADLALLDAALAAADDKPGGPALDRLIELGAANPKSAAPGAALMLLALGAPVGPEARAQLLDFDAGKGVAPAGRLAVMDYAAAAGLKGETALVALVIAADAGPAGPALADRARIVAALARAGLAEPARRFAVEGLLTPPPAK